MAVSFRYRIFSGPSSVFPLPARAVPQMGATVILYNHQDRQIGKVLSDENGQFRLAGLYPSLYSLRVTLASFVPADPPGHFG